MFGVIRSLTVPNGPKSPGAKPSEVSAFGGPAGVAAGVIASVAAVIAVALIVLGSVFWRQRRRLLALQRVIDSSASALDQVPHGSSSIGLQVINSSSELNPAAAINADDNVALQQTADMYGSLQPANVH